MPQTTKNPTLEIDEELSAVVRAGCYDSEEEALRDAVHALFAVKPQLRLEAAIRRYQDGEVTLGRAAEIAGVTRWRFQELLAQRSLPVEIEARSVEELDAAVAQIRKTTIRPDP